MADCWPSYHEIPAGINCSAAGLGFSASPSYATARRSSKRRRSWFSSNQWHQVEALLKRKWSHEQVSFTLKEQGICSISHETIYRYILKDKKAGGNLYRFMRIMPKKRRKRYNSKDSRGVLRGKRHITERPAEVELRQEPGHWEGDTVIGVDKRFSILTLVERRSGFAIIKKLKGSHNPRGQCGSHSCDH
jgi:IS30 family transposase